jgi:Cu-processing system permease protein
VNAARLGTVIALELTQRLRSVAWYVMLGVFALILLGVTGLSFVAFSYGPSTGAAVYSVVVFVDLLLVVLVSPTFSGNAINSDREHASLAAVQVTRVTTGELVCGKFLAAWITGLAFALVSAPFLIVATAGGGVDAVTVLVSLAVLFIEVGVIAGIAVGLSGVIARPLFSVAGTYLVVAALVFGTVISFGLSGAAIRTSQTDVTRDAVFDDNGTQTSCGHWQTSHMEVPRFDRVWWMLAANPFVILADATPTRYGPGGTPDDLFGQLTFLVRSAQLAPPAVQRWDGCAEDPSDPGQETPRQIIDRTTPSWFVGLGLQIVLAAALMAWAWGRTRTPMKRLPPGTRIA